MSSKINLISGSPIKKVLLLSFPLIISNIMHVIYNIVDTAWLGMLGKEEVAAMAFVFPVIFLVVSVGIGISIAGSVLVAQYEGAGEKEKVNFVAAQTFTFTFMLSIIIAFAGYYSSEPLVRLLGAGEKVVPLAVDYLQVIYTGIILIFSFFVFNALMRGWGNTKTPMKILVVSNLANIILDPLFIFGWGFVPAMGMKGAALATVLSRLGAAAAGLYILFKGRHALKITFAELKPHYEMLKKIFVIGWPAILEHAARSLGIMALTAVIAVFGTVYVAAFGIGTRVFSVFVMPSLALSMGVASAVGQNVGANLTERARKVACQSAFFVFMFLTAAAILLYFLRNPAARIFIQTPGNEVVDIASSFIARLAIAAPFLGAAITLRGAFKGAGRTLHSMMIGIAGLWGVRVTWALIMVYYFKSASAVWNAFVLSGVAELALCILYYMKGGWLSPVIKQETGVITELPEENRY